MGEAPKRPLRLDFNRRLKLEFRGATITSDVGLLAFRELDETLGLRRVAAQKLADRRPGKNVQHQLVALFRQAVFGRLAGYEDVNDTERLWLDPVMRALVGHGDALRFGASTSEMARSETELLATEETLKALGDLPSLWIGRVQDRMCPRELVLDMNSSEASPTASRKAQPSTVTSAAPATIPCSCSTSSATWRGRCFGRAMCTVRRDGARC